MTKLVVALCLAICLVPQGLAAQDVMASDPGLQPGDLVEITVWQREELSGQFPVSQDGTLVHPLYQQVRVTGLPPDQVQDRLRSFLSQFESNPQVVVRPLYQVVVGGQVFRPDIYTVQPGTTISQVVTLAGGATETGDIDEVQLRRGTNESEINLRDPASIQLRVQSGDQILVKEAGGFDVQRLFEWIRFGALTATIIARTD